MDNQQTACILTLLTITFTTCTTVQAMEKNKEQKLVMFKKHTKEQLIKNVDNIVQHWGEPFEPSKILSSDLSQVLSYIKMAKNSYTQKKNCFSLGAQAQGLELAHYPLWGAGLIVSYLCLNTWPTKGLIRNLAIPATLFTCYTIDERLKKRRKEYELQFLTTAENPLKTLSDFLKCGKENNFQTLKSPIHLKTKNFRMLRKKLDPNQIETLASEIKTLTEQRNRLPILHYVSDEEKYPITKINLRMTELIRIGNQKQEKKANN